MTFNIANYDDHNNSKSGYWIDRLSVIADVIIENKPDIIALQEIRFNPDQDSTKDSYQNMGEQVLSSLNGSGEYIGSQILTQPVMFYPETTEDFYPILNNSGSVEWEGLSIISSPRVIETGSSINIPETGTRFLSIVNEAGDSNKRSVKYALMKSSTVQSIYIFNCHYSYDIENFQQNVKETIEYMKPFLQFPCILMGDMNQTEANPEENIALKVKESFDLFRFHGLYDVWEKLNPNDPGYTDPEGAQRIDYIWANFDNISSIEIVGNEPNDQGVYASDHYGLIAQID